MSFMSWLKGEENHVSKEVVVVEHDAEAAARKAEQDLLPVIENEKVLLRGLVLQTLNDSKAELKNAEKPLSEDAAAAVDKLIDDVVQALIREAL